MPFTSPVNWLVLKRIVRFGDTDAAGVMHFHQLFRWCHEAWEESLEKYGLPAAEIFPSNSKEFENPDLLLPIVHCEADYFSPIQTGDRLKVDLAPKKLSLSCFHVEYKFHKGTKNVATALITHCAIDSTSRIKCNLPVEIIRWIEASTLNQGVMSI